MLQGSDQPLATLFDVALLDLDGVVYAGAEPVPHAAAALAQARAAGMHLAFITNNASRTPEQVARRVSEAGVPAEPAEVVTSAQAAAAVLVERFGAGATVAVLGGEGLQAACESAGLGVVEVAQVEQEHAVAIVSGFGPDVLWRDIMRAAVWIRDGLPWVASNTDSTFPTDYGIAPGHGVLVQTLSRFAGVEPTVAGKPARPLFEETLARTQAQSPLMVGDRLDTDIEGAHVAQIPSLLVLTGVSGLTDLLDAPAEHRPTYLAPDLRGLLTDHPEPTRDDDAWACGGWRAEAVDGHLRVSGRGSAGDWWRAVASAAWAATDAGSPVRAEGLEPPTDDPDDKRGGDR